MDHQLSMETIIKESLTESMYDIFDDRNENCMEEGAQFINTISAIRNTKSSALRDIFDNVIRQSTWLLINMDENSINMNQFININSNGGEENSPIDNQPLSNVEVFTTLYNKGYIKEPYMQRHITRQIHSLKSTFSDLMGRDWMGGILGSNAPQTSLNDWIDSDYIVEWNKKLCESELGQRNLTKEDLIRAIMFQTTNLSKSVADGTYEDMCVNAIMCYDFAALVASIVRLGCDSDTITKTKMVIKKLISFGETFGKNDFFTCCCMVINLLYATMTNEDRISDPNYSKTNAELFDSWLGNHLMLPNKNSFPFRLSSLLESLELEFGFCITREDARSLGIPTPILMPERIHGEDVGMRPNGMILEESVEFGQSFSNTVD